MDDETVRKRSKTLFENAQVLPVAGAIVEQVKVGSDFTAPDIRAWVGGRAADNQIHGVLSRLEAAGALVQLPYPGRPHPRRWERVKHPLWRFVTDWAAIPATPARDNC